MPLIKAVMDVNTLVSATIVKGNEFRLLKKAEQGEFILLLSNEILSEFIEVISRPKFGYSRQMMRAVMGRLILIAAFVRVDFKLRVIEEDVEDNRVLEYAVAGKANYITSGNHYLLDLCEYKRIKILKRGGRL